MTPSTNADIDRYIRPFLTKDPTSRPFLCQGSPIGCEVAVVGINPATTTPFKDVWTVETGCNKLTWMKEYRKAHKTLKPTRDRLELFCQALGDDLRCLELNLFSRPSQSEATLSKAHRATELFEFMLQACKPKVLLVHGKSPIAHLSRLLNVTLQKDTFTPALCFGQPVQIFAAKRHLAYVSRDYSTSVGGLIANQIQYLDPLA